MIAIRERSVYREHVVCRDVFIDFSLSIDFAKNNGKNSFERHD